MILSIHTTHLSSVRFRRYIESCNNNDVNTVKLYKLNIKLSQRLYAYLGIFEVVLRNKIDERLKYYFNSNNYLLEQKRNPESFLNMDPDICYHKNALEKAIRDLRKANKPVTHDRLVATLSFGFWTELYGKYTYSALNGNLSRVFRNKDQGTGRKAILNLLNTIRKQRNRIAHHEPLCLSFDKTVSPWISVINIDDAERLIRNIELLYRYMDVDPALLNEGLPEPLSVIAEINEIKNYVPAEPGHTN